MSNLARHNYKESGNAFVYILIAVVLFAALSFVLIRQEDSKETGVLTPDTARIIATQMISTAAEVKGGLDQMVFAGTHPSEFGFEKPSAFGAAPHYDKVFHPDGGGISLPSFPVNALPSVALASPVSGWYLGRFNNVGWTDSTNHDVILTAYGINQMVCQEINNLIIGTTAIPQLTVTPKSALVDVAEHSGSNNDITIVTCPDANCKEQMSLCVQDAGGTVFAFFNIVETQ